MIGQKINNYEVRSLLGEGGMGSVYVAEHPVLGRRAAVKVLRKEYAVDSNLVGRFINEARASSAIKHPGIIEVFDVGTMADGVPYLMMELLEGETLGRRIDRDGPLKVPDAVDIAAQATSALAAAHAHGIVHRDLKPENLFLIPDPSQRSHAAGEGAGLRHRQAAAPPERAVDPNAHRIDHGDAALYVPRAVPGHQQRDRRTAPTFTRWASSCTRC